MYNRYSYMYIVYRIFYFTIVDYNRLYMSIRTSTQKFSVVRGGSPSHVAAGSQVIHLASSQTSHVAAL